MLVIHFSHLCMVYWWFMIDINYHQQTPPHLGFYSSSIKGWITLDITLGQGIDIKLFLVIHALQDSKCLSWNFGRLKNGIAWNRSPSSFSQVNWRNILRFSKQNIAYFLLPMVFTNHSIYMIFVDPYQGIDVFAFFSPTTKGLCGA
jgi:hypothetical protein